MGVPVDETREDRLAAGVDDMRRAMAGADLVGRADLDDAVPFDRDGAVLDDSALRIDGDHDAAGDEDIGHRSYPCRVSAGASPRQILSTEGTRERSFCV